MSSRPQRKPATEPKSQRLSSNVVFPPLNARRPFFRSEAKRWKLLLAANAFLVLRLPQKLAPSYARGRERSRPVRPDAPDSSCVLQRKRQGGWKTLPEHRLSRTVHVAGLLRWIAAPFFGKPRGLPGNLFECRHSATFCPCAGTRRKYRNRYSTARLAQEQSRHFVPGKQPARLAAWLMLYRRPESGPALLRRWLPVQRQGRRCRWQSHHEAQRRSPPRRAWREPVHRGRRCLLA